MAEQMACDCSVDPGGEMAEFFSCEIRTARKEHNCCECGKGQIKPGQKYEYVKGNWEGDFSVFKTCAPCLAIRERFCPNGYAYGNLAEQLFDCLGFDHLTVPENEEDNA